MRDGSAASADDRDAGEESRSAAVVGAPHDGRRILVHDYVGHPFQVQLSREIARRGHRVRHMYSASIQTPRGRLERTGDDPDLFDVEAVRLPSAVRKRALVRRWLSEVEYGHRLADAVADFDPEVVLSANAPLEAQRILQALSRRKGHRFVYWAQDLYGVATHRILRKRLPVLGELAGRWYVHLESRLLRNSDHVVLISEDFRKHIPSAVLQSGRVSVIPNWAPIEEMPLAPRDNAWARRLGINSNAVVMYAGTLGMKHNPRLLLEVARRLHSRPNARLVVVSEGDGAEWLERQAHEEGLTSLLRLDFQPFEIMPQVLASSDVLLVILEADAGTFSVPSKVLTYLAAGRPIVGAMPLNNLAARTLVRSGAGHVTTPDDQDAFAHSVLSLLADPTRGREMGNRGRRYAECEFDIHAIADRFVPILVGER